MPPPTPFAPSIHAASARHPPGRSRVELVRAPHTSSPLDERAAAMRCLLPAADTSPHAVYPVPARSASPILRQSQPFARHNRVPGALLVVDVVAPVVPP